jgi:hypothetical protein
VQEQPKIEELIDILERKGLEPGRIITLLSSIIKQQMMYGGSLEDKINFHIEANKNSL